jgi:serine/threonine protein kinase
MNAIQPTAGSPARTPAELGIRELLDVLTQGGCDSATFLESMRERIRVDHSANWEVLSLLDQYYRRGKISKELFQDLRIGMAEFALGVNSEEVAQPRPTPSARPTAVLHPATAQTAAPPQPRSTATPLAPVRPNFRMPESATVTAPAVAREAPLLEIKKSSPAAEVPRELSVGDVLRSRYRIVGIVGQGGMGTVYEADDNYRLDIPPTGQSLAIKVLHTSVTKRAELFSELRREFQHLQALSHPNIVRAYEFDRDGALAFFTMELLNGSLLSHVLLARNRVRLERPEAWAIVRDVGSAIAYAHSRNIVHGDINPQNIFLTLRGNVRVLDFGASHSLADSGGGEIEAAAFATPGYVSCQVLEGERPDARDDIFALACVAYLLLGGEHPFANRTATEARARGIKPKRPVELRQRQWRALRAGLHWDREKRPADMATWLQAMDLTEAAPRLRALSDLTDNPVPPRRKFGFAVAMTAAAAVALAGIVWIGMHYSELSAQLASMVDQTADIRTAAPIPPPPTDTDFTPPPNLSGLKSSTSPAPSALPAPIAKLQPATPPPAAAAPQSPSPPAPAPPSAPAPVTSVASTAAPAAATAAAHPATPRLSQIELAADTVDVPLNEPSASVLVHRKGNVRDRVGFTWWTESGTAKPVTDFAPVSPHVEYFEEGKSTVTLSIRLTDTLRAQDKSFYVVIDEPQEGGTLGPRGLTMVTLPGNQPSR